MKSYAPGSPARRQDNFQILDAAFKRLRAADPTKSADEILEQITRPPAITMRDWQRLIPKFSQYARRLPPPLTRAQVSPSRDTDPDTAQIAALINSSLRGRQRVDVLLALYDCGERGATDFELSEHCSNAETKMLRTSAGKRRKELVDVGCAMITDDRRSTDTDSPAVVWRITSLGRKAVEQIREHTH